MTGHMIRLEIESSFDKVFKNLAYKFCKIYYNIFKLNDKRIGIMLDEKWFLRTGSVAGLAIIIEELSDLKVRIEIISFAGGEGLLNISWGSHKSYCHDVLNHIKKAGFKILKIDEIDYLDTNRLPNDMKEKVSMFI